MNCPACGRPQPEGKAYCSNPACAMFVKEQAPEVPIEILDNEGNVKLNFKTVTGIVLLVLFLIAIAFLNHMYNPIMKW